MLVTRPSIDAVAHLRARDRNVGVIFQNYALFPRMNVVQNIGFGLRIRGVRRKKRADVVTDGGKADDILANAPARDGNYFLVPKVVE